MSNLLIGTLVQTGVKMIILTPDALLEWAISVLREPRRKVLITGPSGLGKTYVSEFIRRGTQHTVVHIDALSRSEKGQHLVDLERMPTGHRIYEGWADNILPWAKKHVTHILMPIPDLYAFKKINELKADRASKDSTIPRDWIDTWRRMASIKLADYNSLIIDACSFLSKRLPQATLCVYTNYVTYDSLRNLRYGWHEDNPNS
jgi:hypothetical protein